MKKRFALVIALGLIILSFGSYLASKKNKTAIVSIGGHKFSSEIAQSSNEREKGLGNKKSLCADCAMLFIFPQKGEYSFWMKDMKFNLDIIWLYEEKVAYIAKNVSYKDPYSINPGVEADKVLEINAGLSDKYGISIGDKMEVK